MIQQHILIADSGSTKTEWILVNNEKESSLYHTTGFNPFIIDSNYITQEVKRDLLSQIEGKSIDFIFFYGAGCSTQEKRDIVYRGLSDVFPKSTIVIDHDLMAAAKSLCGDEAGIACILGTGSNSCVYNGSTVTKELANMGYMLGDEGSGCYLGKLLLKSYCYEKMPPDIRKAFIEQYHLSPKELVAEIYKAKKPNTYLASYTTFLGKHKEHPFIKSLLQKGFSDFIDMNLLLYPEVKEFPIHFVGSIAHYFSDVLQQTLEKHGLQLGKIIQKPIHGLINYHIFEIQK